ncbi:Dynein heavy chain 6, axonemal [Boothiomyces sp. JEL0866]|nr:Dynein heavy chain 6, axonemal [Boothiomyces sp. JEL0866]
MDEELEVEIPERRISPSPATQKERRPSSASRLPKLKAQTNASLQFTQQLQSRIATTTSNSTTPHFEYGDSSIFTSYIIDSENEMKQKTLLAAKRIKINPGVPVAAIQKHVEQRNSAVMNKAAIPPIKREQSERATSGTSGSSSSQQVQISMHIDVPPAEGGETNKMDSPFSFLNYLKQHPQTDEFVYLVPVTSTQRGQPSYNPYNLQIVDFFQINTKSSEGYYTMSAKGITHINQYGQGTFTPLDQWCREYELYHKLLKIPFFARYRSWKCFTLWKNTVLHTKILSAKKLLQKQLFILHPSIRPALLAINNHNMDIVLEKRLVAFEEQKTLELNDFVREQRTLVEKVTAEVLTPWESQIREIVETASMNCLVSGGFDVKTVNENENTENKEEVKKLTFTEQAARRTECKKLARFVKLADYMMVTTLQMLAIASVQDLLKYTFRGCQDSDVIVDDIGVGTAFINEYGVIVPNPENSNGERTGDNVYADASLTGVQVGGVVVGKEVKTSQLIECGFDGFSDILSRLVVASMQKIELTEIIEEEGVNLDATDSMEALIDVKPTKKPEETKWKSGAEKSKQFVPLFRTELMVERNAENARFYFSSSLADYLATLDILLKIYLSTIERIGQLTNTISFLDSSNLAGGSYSAVRGLDDPEYGDGPQVGLIVLEGGYFKELCGRIRGVLVGMFANASNWLNTLDNMKNMWINNETFKGLESLRREVGELAYLLATSTSDSHEGGAAAIIMSAKQSKDLELQAAGAQEAVQSKPFNILEYGATASKNSDGIVVSAMVDFFESSLRNFANQKQIMTSIPTKSVINNLLVDSTTLKGILVPSPERCFEEVAKLLPGLARDKNELLLTEIQTWVRILNTHPTTVEGFVEYLGWLEKVQDSLETVDILEAETIQLYNLLDNYKIYIQPTDLAMFQTLSPTIRSLKEAVEIAVDTKEDNINKFTVDLEKLLTDLSSEVSEIRNSAQDPMVLNSSSNNDEVIAYLEDLRKQLEKVEVLKSKYESWGRLFKSGGKKLSDTDEGQAENAPPDESNEDIEMEETKKEVELKNSLWSSLKDWDKLADGWKTQAFDTLVTDDINAKILMYLKIAYNLDKGLPPNEVVPKLKELVEEYRKMYPTIVDLRNPALKQRHWDKIQDAVGKPLVRDENFTLGHLIECRVFDFKEEIGHISSQAGSEAALDEMLTKVVKLWNDAEFIVTPYRDIKDVFILGTVEEIQTLLEDSQVTIATIKGSRFIGPIKAEVERWDKMLSLFSETLDAWLICQRNWLYLESIFSAPDIQRQLPEEARMFAQVDRSWKDVMRKVSRNPNAIKAGTMPGLLETMQQNNILLEQIQKCLEDYLESKRLLFPRFYFLSNDELLEILSQTKNPQAVQPHLSKCFDAIKSLEFSSNDPKSIDIIGMNSPEGERVQFLKTIKARGNVEGWLGNVEEGMVAVLRRLIKIALAEYDETKRSDWVREHVGQVVVTGNQVIWSKDVSEALKTSEPNKALITLKQKSIANLSGLAMLVRGDLTKIQRAILGALITIDVHNRDIIQSLISAKVTSAGDFEWTKQQRYYWDVDSDTCHVKMSTSVFSYGYEYLGCSPRLVITPLTDRCYLTLTGAMQLNLGGSPVGPAGTGKTETVKDLAKAMAKQCVVFNCSDGMDYKMMGKMFAGLAQSGAWCCFDEFNRIDIEVLSVIAQQLLTIKNAKDIKATRFIFEGREIRLIETCCAFITMNPGYAGRTELPDNLKALFRPIAMMIPDYGLIAEIMLFSEGFENAKVLAGKVVNLYKLCSEQLSQQDHYDFGMRAVKSVLIMAGSLKRSAPELSEDVVLIRSLRDSNLPKFLSEDIGLFKGILSDLFPGVVVPERDFGTLVGAVKEVMAEKQMEIVDGFVSRICQLAETMKIRHGVMLVGPTGGGKTSCYEILQTASTNLRERGNKEFERIKTWVLNPKCVSMNELYGEFNLATMEWKDGLIGNMFRAQVTDNSPDEKWTVCDGPVDALWIENMNTVLDDNKLLTLINGERIKMSPSMHMLFEVGDLAVASPATVSRCGMVYMDPAILGWQSYVKMWLRKQPEKVTAELKDYLLTLFTTYVDKGLQYVRRHGKEYIKSVDLNLVVSLCRLLQTYINKSDIDFKKPIADLQVLFANIFIFCYVWSIGGNLADGCQEGFDTWFRDYLEVCPINELSLPTNNLVFGYFVDLKRGFIPWEDIVPVFKYSSDIPYFQMMVPTVDTVKYAYLLEALLTNSYATLFSGETGVGKSVIVQDLLNRIGKQNKYINVVLNFSAQTSSAQTQQMMELKVEKKRKNISGAPAGFNKIVLFVDDLNMPKLDTYGSQASIELLRQYVDYSGFYDREKLFWKVIQDVELIAACAPPGGGRNQITPRFLRHFNMLSIPSPSELSLAKIFKCIVEGFLKPFSAEVKASCDAIVNSSIEIYHRMLTELLPTPAKSHYTFNLRDLSKVVQGILQVRPQTISTRMDLARLFCHESSRVFHDRLIDDNDRRYFNQLLSELSDKNFGASLPKENFSTNPIMFCDFTKRGVPAEDRIYLEISDMKLMTNLLEEYLEEYNVTMNKELRLIFFMDAKQHITRISRIIRQPRGNALLVGVGGTGKQSLTRLACHISDYQCIQIELTRTYGDEEWHEDLKKLYRLAGVEGKNTVFLLSDTQIKSETFLEDVNNILNSGEVPNLIEFEEREKILGELRPIAREKGLGEDRDSVYQFFINRVRDNLHIVLGTSPVGDTFRNRCRMFPSLVNCCTIDWFDEWPKEALLSVSTRFLEFVDLGSDQMKEKIAAMCVEIHSSVGELAKKFWSELRRRYYTTPTSYLELINIYVKMLSEQRKELGTARDRLRNGLNKLAETNELVANMQIELNVLGPELKVKAADTEELMIKIAKDQETADGVRKIVSEEEAIVREAASQTEAIANDAQRDLDAAIPALESAFKALDALEKKDIAELKVFSKPPDAVLMVMEAICILFKSKPDWENSKKILGDPQLMKKMQEYDKDTIPEAITKKLRKYIEMPAFNPEAVERVSRACKSMCMWVIAMELYSRVFKEVAPKRKRLEEAQQSLESTRAKLAEKAAALQEVENQLEKLKATYENSVLSKKQLLEKMEETTKRLARANKLTTALADEQVRWTESVEKLNVQIDSLVGNIFLSAAAVAYYGAFTSVFREELVQTWIKTCTEMEIPVSQNFNLVDTLSDPAVVRDWNIQGLPSDSLSIENGLLVTKGRRWPLMIDPQGQANRWIRNMEGSELKVIKLSEPKFLRSLENAVRTGQPVLIEDVGEQLDPALEPLLLKQTVRQGGRVLMKLGDSLVEYDRNFKLYITTKLQNPHYLPEVCIKVTIINFTVTKAGLEGQLLADVVKLERPELEEQRNSLIVNIAADKKQLKDIEEKILKLLFNSQGNILDDEELITILNQSKVTSSTINIRLAEAQETEVNINTARERYRPVAIRGSVLYFVMADLAEMDPMYHFSLKYFKNLFVNTIKESEPSDVLPVRIRTLCKNITFDTFTNVSRGLFEAHKLIFAFMICIETMREKNLVDPNEWNFFLRGSGVLRNNLPPKPPIRWLSPYMWQNLCDLAYTIPQFAYTIDHVNMYPTDWETLVESDQPNLVPVPGDTTSQLTDVHKLLLVKVLREEKVVPSAIEFVKRNLGPEYIDIPPLDLSKAYKDTNPATPLIFILSTGSDPVTQLMKFAGSPKMNMQDKLQMISLGQGQGPIAEELVRKATVSGDWVFLQNCHLAASWMNRLEAIVKEFGQGEVEINPKFRLFLSSMPSKVFPVSVLQESVKVTNEPPKGLRANLARSFADIPKDLFDDHPPQGVKFKKLLFGVCFFNAIIHERKKFGPLGWNILYDWSNSDLEVSCIILRNILQEYKTIPWEALTYLTGEITFGGRVTDDWDRRALKSILARFYTTSILDDNYQFSPSGIYYAPPDGDMASFKAYIDGLPFTEEPSVFGMHENANISYQLQETRRLIRTVLDVQPRMSTGATGKSSEETVLELVGSILADWPVTLHIDPSSDTLNPTLQILFRRDESGRMLNSLSTVLLQEIVRFNKLNNIVKASLESLAKAVKGLIVMSAELELVYKSLLLNEVPQKWSNSAYPSLKGLGSWVKDFHKRMQMVRNWAELGQPKSFWLPGFFFPQGISKFMQGFLTGVLQNHARKFNIPIDSLQFNYEVKTYDEGDSEVSVSVENEEGALMSGLFLEGARWDREKQLIQDSFPMEMYSPMPLIRFIPTQVASNRDKLYACPLYKTSARAGTLSTTGQSTNFVVTLYIPSDKHSDYWIAKGVALLVKSN